MIISNISTKNNKKLLSTSSKSTIFKQETIKSWFTGINSEVVQPFRNAEQVIWKYNQAIQHNSLTQKGWERLLAQSDDGLKSYLTSVKGATASMTGYKASLQGNFTGFMKISSAIKQYNTLATAGIQKQNEFSDAVAITNGRLGSYLNGLKGSKASLRGYTNSLIVAKTKTVALQTATMALNTIASMGIMMAIQLLIQGLDKLINYTKRASEAANEAFSETNNKVQQNKEELKSLDELIAKYKELKESGELDVESRKEVKELQNSIADLVGVQASNLDLVNGKLDDEIKKLDEISAKQAKNAYETATANYNNSKKAREKAVGDSSMLFVDGYAYIGKREKEAEKILQDAGFVTTFDRNNHMITSGVDNNIFSTIVQDIYDNKGNKLNGAQEKADYLQSMIDVLEQNGQRATDLYAGLIKQRDDYLKYIDDQQLAANSLVDSWVTYSQFSNKTLSKINVNSLESFEKYRQTMIDEIQNDETIAQMIADGILSEESLESTINDFMATSTKFSTWYDQWINGIQDTSNTSQTDALSLDDAKLKVLGDSEKGIVGLKDEFSSLQEIISDTGNVSMETYEKLITKSEGYSRALKIEAGRIVVDNQKLKMVNKTRTESIKKEIKEASTLKKIEWITNAKKLQQYNFQQSDLNAFIWETCNALQEEISQFDLLVQGIDAASNSFTAFQEAQNAAESGDYFDIGLEMANEFQKGLETGRIGNQKFITSMQGIMDEDLFAEIINMDDAVAQAKELDKFYDDVISRYYIEGEDAEYDISGIYNFAKDLASFKDEAGNALYGTFDGKNLKLVDGMDYSQLAKDLKLNVEQIYAIFGELEEYTIGDTYKFDSKNFIEDYYNKLTKVTDAQQLYNDALENGSKNQQTFAKFMLDAANADYQEWLEGLGDKILDLEQQWQEQGESNQSFGEYLKNSYSDDEIIMMYSTATERAEELRQKLHELEVSGRKGSTEWKNYNAELEKLDDAISAIDNTTEKQELLNEAVQSTKERYERLQEIMDALKDPDLDGESMEKLKQEAYELIAALGQLPKSVEIEFKAKVAELEEKVKTVEEKKAALEKTEVPGYKYSPAYQAQMGEYNAQIRDYNQEIQEIKAILKLDTEEARSEIDKIKAEDVDKEGTVTYTANFDACKKGVPPTLDGTVKYEADYSGVKPPSGGGFSLGGGKQYGTNGAPLGVSANGTFNAFATGTGSQVSIPKNETALVNELGEEGLVRDGKLIPIKGGAQLIDLKKGDIIFNHKQMEDLKKHGYTTGRGKLIGDGGIVGAHFKGTIPAYNGNGGYTGGGGGVIGSNSKYDKTVKNSTRNNVRDVEEKEEKEKTEEFFDWIERRLQKLQRYFDRWFNNAEAMLTKSQMVGGLLAKYYKRSSGNLNKQMDVQSNAYSRYMQQADASGLSDDYKQKVRDGLIDIETITDDELKEQISRYQEWYDKANESLAAFEEAANKRFHIPLDKAAKKVEVFGDAIDLLDKKLDNAIGAKAKNELIGNKSDKTSANTMFAEEKKTLNAYKVAQKESAKNLKSQGKKMTSSSILKGSDVSSKEKKKIKNAVKSGKEIDIAYFDEGSKAYKQAVKYNEALRANTQAQYDLNVATEEYNAWLVEAAKMKFDNIATDYENAIKQIDNSFTDIDNKIAEIEAAGKRVGKSLYESQKKLNDQELAKLKNELVALEESKKGIKKNTDEWFEALDAIQEVENAISSCVQETAKLNKSITELHYSMIADMAEGVNRIIEEQDLLQELFSHEKLTDDDTGNFTDAGIAKLGSITAQYYAGKEKIDIHKREKEKLEYMKVNNLRSYAGLEFNSDKERDDRYNQINDLIREDYREVYNKEKEMFDLMNERYQAELSYIKQLIDDQKEALQRQKDLHDYQNTINEKVNNIDTLQRQISAYSGDTSEEGMAKLQKLQKELNDAQKDLKETEYDRYISDQQDMLDKFYEDYEETITNQLEDFKGIVKEAIVKAEENMANIDTFLKTVAKENGYDIEEDGLFNGVAGDIASNISDAVADVVDTINDSVDDGDDADDDSGSNNGSSNSSSANSSNSNSNNTSNNSNKVDLNNGTPDVIKEADEEYAKARAAQLKQEWANKKKKVEKIFGDSKLYKKGEKKKTYKTEINKYLMKNNGKVLTTAGLKELREALMVKKNSELLNAMKELKEKNGNANIKNVGGFKTGGIARLVRSKGEDGIAMVRNGEGFVAPEHVLAIQELLDTVPLVNDMFKPLVDAPKLPNLTPVNSMGNNVLQIDTLTLPNVTNYEEFRDKMYKDMQSNKKFEGMVQDMSINQVSGGGRLSKYNRRF